MPRLTRSTTLLVATVSLAIAGCQSTPATVPQTQTADYGYRRVAAGTSFVERHPLLYEPVQQYKAAGPNPVVKVLAGAASVPLGIVKEANQILMGR